MMKTEGFLFSAIFALLVLTVLSCTLVGFSCLTQFDSTSSEQTLQTETLFQEMQQKLQSTLSESVAKDRGEWEKQLLREQVNAQKLEMDAAVREAAALICGEIQKTIAVQKTNTVTSALSADRLQSKPVTGHAVLGEFEIEHTSRLFQHHALAATGYHLCRHFQ